jgi:hypothetical protein
MTTLMLEMKKDQDRMNKRRDHLVASLLPSYEQLIACPSPDEYSWFIPFFSVVPFSLISFSFFAITVLQFNGPHHRFNFE